MAKEYTGEVIALEPEEYTGDIIYDDKSIPQAKNLENVPVTKSQEDPNRFLHGTASALDTLWGIVPGAINWGTYATERALQKSPKEAQEIAQRITAPLESPVGRAFGVTETPGYKGEGSRAVFNKVGELVGGSSEKIAEKTGIPKEDVENIIQSGLMLTPAKMPKFDHPLFTKAQETASNVKEKIAEAPARYMAYQSKLDPQDIVNIYRIYKENHPDVVKAFEEGQKSDVDWKKTSGIYNYAVNTLGLPPEYAIKATHYNQDLERGAWMIHNLYKNQIPKKMRSEISPEEFQRMREELLASIKSPEATQAEMLGYKSSDYLPQGKNRDRAIAQFIGFEGLPALAFHSLFHGLGAIPSLLTSPRFTADVARRAGQASRLGSKYVSPLATATKEIVPPILRSTPKAIGALSASKDAND